MTVLQSIILGLIQGIAEFLPISSSGHLQVAQHLFKLEEVPLLFDVFLHLATLLAVVIFFRKKIIELFAILFRWIFKKAEPERSLNENQSETNSETSSEKNILSGTDLQGRKTIIAVLITTLITGVLGVVSSKLIPELSIKFTCAGFLVTSAFLIVSSILEKRTVATLENVTPLQAIIIGIMQGIGTLPGISRSGSTIAGSLFCKMDRQAAGEYSFIVSIPAILGAFVLELKDLDEMTSTIGVLPILTGCLVAFVSGYLALAFLMRLIKKGKLQWFAAYLIPLAIAGFIWF